MGTAQDTPQRLSQEAPDGASRRAAQPSVWALGVRIARRRPGRFAAGVLLWVSFWTAPVLIGLALRAALDAISGGAAAGLDVPTLLALLVAAEGTRLVLFYFGIVVFVNWWAQTEAWLRANLLAAQLANRREEQGQRLASGAETIPVFRDDVHDLVQFVDSWLDVTGTLVFAAVSLSVMATIDPLLSLVVALPLAAVVVVVRVLAVRLREARLADREATARVTGFLGTAFASVQALKVSGAEERAVERLRTVNAERRRTALRDRLLADSLDAFSGSTVDVTLGLVLLLVASSLRAGEFSLGDLGLFASYVSALAAVPRWMGLLLARHRHAQVSARRAGALMPGGDPRLVVAPREQRLDGAPPPARARQPSPGPAEVALEGFGTGDGRVTGFDLLLPAGSFTVVCGEVGSGKSSLLRALLGLAGPTEGTVRWNGEAVDDLAAHMTPPRCAYVPQVPRLFSATLRENLAVGLEATDEALSRALRRAAFDGDLAEMSAGLDTLVGPRGVRLSGGQLQRAATGRALAADPGLLVFDDLSSALDADTERRVWARVTDEQRATVLAVSHRAGAMERADQIAVVSGGQLLAVGSREELRAAGIDPLRPEASARTAARADCAEGFEAVAERPGGADEPVAGG